MKQSENLHRIKTHQRPQWQSLKDSVIINDIETFAQEILEQAREHQLSQLEQFAEKLLQQSQAFALDQVQLTKASFEDILHTQEVEVMP